MGFSLRKCVVYSAFASLLLFCSCEEHKVGEMPELQKEHLLPEKANQAEAGAAATGQTPAAKPTPADFFPETKP